jgi:hypothetical protein
MPAAGWGWVAAAPTASFHSSSRSHCRTPSALHLAASPRDRTVGVVTPPRPAPSLRFYSLVAA